LYNRVEVVEWNLGSMQELLGWETQLDRNFQEKKKKDDIDIEQRLIGC